MKSVCEHWNKKNYENKTQPYNSLPAEAHFTLKGGNIPTINHVKFPGVIFNKRH